MIHRFHQPSGVFSAHAEVVPRGQKCWFPLKGILRARGGSSDEIQIAFDGGEYSPRMRR